MFRFKLCFTMSVKIFYLCMALVLKNVLNVADVLERHNYDDV